jgi:hypothetical protein
LISLIVLMPFVLNAENAKLPYSKVYEMQHLQSKLSEQYTNLVVALRMESTATNVTERDLDVYIDSKSGKIPIKLGADGDFTVPMRGDLLAEDPWIITNQPRGTMKLDWFLGLVMRNLTKSIRYKSLMQVVRDSGEVRQRMRQVLPTAPKAPISGLRLMFSSGANASLVIHSERGDKKMGTDARGGITMEIDPALLDEDPLVTFSQEPASVDLVTLNQPE